MPVKAKLRRAAPGDTDLTRLPAPATTADRVVLEIRKFLAAGIFFNAQAAEKAGLGLTDMQMLHMLQLYGPSTPSQLGKWTRLSSGGVTVALDRLEKGGYLRRERNPADRRSLLIVLIPTRLRKIAANVNPTSTKPIAEKTMILRRFLFFGFAIRSLFKTRVVADLFQIVGPFADKSCPSGLAGRLQVRSKIVNPAYLPHPGRTITATNTAQAPKSQIAALP